MVHLDQDGVADTFLDATRQTAHVGHKKVVAHQLHAVAHHVGELLPRRPVVFVQAVLDGHDGVLVAPPLPEVHHLRTCALVACAFELVQTALLVVELRRGRIHGQQHVLTWTVSRLFYRLEDHFHSFFVAAQVGGKATFIPHVGAVALGLQHALEVVEDLGAHAQAVGERLCAHRHDHEFLDVDLVVGVRATVQDVHHGHGKGACTHTPHVAVQWQSKAIRCGTCGGKADAQNGVRTQVSFVLRAVQFQHGLVDETLVCDVHAHKRLLQFVVHVGHCAFHALAHPSVSAVAQFDRFVHASGSP